MELKLDVYFNATLKKVTLVKEGQSFEEAEYIKIGAITHDSEDTDDNFDNQKFSENHVIYHHVQELLYKQGITNMQNLSISFVEPTEEEG